MTKLQVVKGGEALGMGLADYIWVTAEGDIAFKKRVIQIGKDLSGENVPLLPRWASTSYYEAAMPERSVTGSEDEFVILSPCFFVPDPTRPQPSYLVLCEVRDAHDHCVPSNYRSRLRRAMSARGPNAKLVWFGFMQDYRLSPPADPPPSGRAFLASERHLGACFDAGLLIHSTWNYPETDDWDFKIGVRHFSQDLDPDPPSALTVCDHLTVARYLMDKIAAEKSLLAVWHKPLTAYVSTSDLREQGRESREQIGLLRTQLAREGRTVRRVIDPITGGDQCLAVAGGDSNPYKFALEILTAVWPLEDEDLEDDTAKDSK